MSASESPLVRLLGDQTLRVLDVGARGDLAPRFAPLGAHVAVLGFEPNSTECARLNDVLRVSLWREARVLPYALGRTATGRPFYVTEAPELSSLLEPRAERVNRPGWQVRAIERVDTIALDDLAARGELPRPIDFIKVDTQGSELEILRGGEASVLDGVLGLAVEVEFRELYRDQPLFSEIEQYLRGRGFELLLLEPAHLRTEWPLARKRTSYADALFLRGPSWVAAQAPTPETRRRLLALYLLHGLHAEAYDLAADPELAEEIAATYRRIAWSKARWRLRLVVEALRCAARPTPANRHRLARLARTVYTPDGRSWPTDPP
jgi:FkbM family methyltransferase